jgi:hypothetical protein
MSYLGVALLGLAGAAREDNEAALVLLQARDVGLHALDGPVLAAVVNGNTDRAGRLWVRLAASGMVSHVCAT